jgi:hypothetical protein
MSHHAHSFGCRGNSGVFRELINTNYCVIDGLYWARIRENQKDLRFTNIYCNL